MIIWLTGMSGSGKSTLSNILIKKFKKKDINFISVDGDVVRDLFDNDLNHSLKHRLKQINRIKKITKFLNLQKQNVIVSALYSNPEILENNRKIFKNYFEVYLKVPISILLKRDIKNLYKRALNKKIKNVVGVDIPWIEPKKSNLLIDQSKKITPNKIANEIIKILLNERNKFKF
tara:strand:+ start:361 stop:885 length:525 start_codon:yes stop_codon:yes gene_type:complete